MRVFMKVVQEGIWRRSAPGVCRRKEGQALLNRRDVPNLGQSGGDQRSFRHGATDFG
jgi:hypothetical protein